MTAVQQPGTERREEIEANLADVGDAVQRSSSVNSTHPPRLVAVSKYKPASDILAAYNNGQRHFGENYVQELCEKAAELPSDINWHFIGRIQSNKCKALAAVSNLWAVETIDSEAKARKLNDAWESAGHPHALNVFIQVNTSDEESKGGVEQHQVEGVACTIAEECKKLRLLGLMTIGSIEGSHQCPNPDFLRLCQLRDDLNAKLGLNLELSMGMSDDFEHALELGATNVRVGSRIFGSRAPKALQ
ncbi:hypothetical protein GGI19_001076 [Coemansia pectinata]|uniref:Pyridoxal phosphate homeostasis protein n=1 Tax=Coemansia pectinata TaxID=1052879 RepID=A0A9W8H518_9FUNG|nr:hypothetical protein GGI19_001076 [Coemansia pectinata]